MLNKYRAGKYRLGEWLRNCLEPKLLGLGVQTLTYNSLIKTLLISLQNILLIEIDKGSLYIFLKLSSNSFQKHKEVNTLMQVRFEIACF